MAAGISGMPAAYLTTPFGRSSSAAFYWMALTSRRDQNSAAIPSSSRRDRLQGYRRWFAQDCHRRRTKRCKPPLLTQSYQADSRSIVQGWYCSCGSIITSIRYHSCRLRNAAQALPVPIRRDYTGSSYRGGSSRKADNGHFEDKSQECAQDSLGLFFEVWDGRPAGGGTGCQDVTQNFQELECGEQIEAYIASAHGILCHLAEIAMR